MKTYRNISPRRVRKLLKANAIAIANRDFTIRSFAETIDFLTDKCNSFIRLFTFFKWSFYVKRLQN